MAVIKAVSSKVSIGQALDYVMKQEKTESKLITGLGCEAETVKEEMQATKELWGKLDGRTYKHFVQSYHKSEQITPEQAHRNAIELAKATKAWDGYEVLIATHTDRGHIHSHIIVNSVSYEDGHKLQWSKADLQDLKDRCNEQSRQQGLHVPEKGKTFYGEEREDTVAWNKETYRRLKQAEKGEVKSYVQEIALAIMDCKETATSRETFMEQMQAKGYGVDWQDKHKYITFVDLARQQQGERQCKVRNNKLESYYAVDFGKETLENGFESNARREKDRADAQKITELMKEKEQDSSLIKQLRNQLQTLSSNNSTLKSELQKKSEMIVSLNEKLTKQNGNDTVLQENRQLKEENKRLEKEADEAKSMIEAMKWTSDHAEDEIKRQVREQVKNAEEQASANLQRQENVLKANFKRKQIKLDKSYAEKEKTLEMAYRGSKRLMWILKAVVAVAVFLIVLAVCTNSQNKAIKKAAQLQECIDEVNTANWYLCGKDMIVYTRVEEFYIPMDRMTLRSGRAVQVPQIGEKWVEIKSQGKIGYILRSDFDEFFSEISINIG